MCRQLALALDIPEHRFSRMVAELEAVSGCPSEDVRLLAELRRDCRRKIGQLGLDAADSTSEEVYQALNAHYQACEKALDRAIGRNATDDSLTSLKKIMKNFRHEPVWAVRTSRLRKILALSPPRRLMKSLGYRSAESLLKRENPHKVLAAAQWSESKTWHSSLTKSLDKLSGSDMELVRLRLFVLDEQKWNPLPADKHTIKVLPVCGAVAVRPVEGAGLLGLLLQVLAALEKLNTQGPAVKLDRLTGYYAKPSRQLAGIAVPSHVLSRYASGAPAQELEDSEPPRPPMTHQVSLLHPALAWWSDSSHLIFTDSSDRPVSLNIADAAANNRNAAGFNQRSLTAGQARLMEEMLDRYLVYQGVQKLLRRADREPARPTPQRTLRRLNLVYHSHKAAGEGWI